MNKDSTPATLAEEILEKHLQGFEGTLTWDRAKKAIEEALATTQQQNPAAADIQAFVQIKEFAKDSMSNSDLGEAIRQLLCINQPTQQPAVAGLPEGWKDALRKPPHHGRFLSGEVDVIVSILSPYFEALQKEIEHSQTPPKQQP